jgi:hypothetical protein
MSSRLRKLTLLALVLLAAGALTACGDSHTKVSSGTYAGESGANAPYLDVGPLKYEVQLSRELNPSSTQDSAYLQGLSPAEQKLEPGQEWFAVFLQVYNDKPQARPAATDVSIADTQGNSYIPIIPAATNPFAYRAGTVPANGRLPEPDTIASADSVQGALLLFKIRTVSLDNRPLTVTIVSPDNTAETASAELDV